MTKKTTRKTVARSYAKGIGDAVADRTINRKLANGKRETWGQVAHRVAVGNTMLHPGTEEARSEEYKAMHHHLAQASLLMSGRHLQHGDDGQEQRNIEIFSNCSTSATSFLSFYLLLNGSGVGRSYDDSMQVVDYANLPIVVPVIDMGHADCVSKEILANDLRTARHFYAGRTIIEYEVEDSREGWAKAIEMMESLAFERIHRDSVLLINFTKVRPRGSPIAGMQGRPASGPGPLISAIERMAALRDAGMPAWRSTMYADHYLAECVLVGGARRAARMATKYWKDRSVLDFIQVKRGGFLWSSNNSVMVDAAFWDGVEAVQEALDIMSISDPVLVQERLKSLMDKGVLTADNLHAYDVFYSVCYSAYHDQTGEPGLINVDRLTWSELDMGDLETGEFAKSSRYVMEKNTIGLMKNLVQVWKDSDYKVITNPCGEVSLSALGGYCTIADVVPYHAQNDDDAESAFRVAARALIRVNQMEALYGAEVKRTNRIGVGMTGLHEYAWARFGYGWKDLVNEERSKDFWKMLSRFSNACVDEALSFSAELGVNAPHTVTTIKPAGCASLDTQIKTSLGILSMKELFAANGISEDQILNTPDGTWIEPPFVIQVLDQDNVSRDITKLYVNGVKPVFEIEFEDGTITKLTGNHKLLTLSGWKRVDELVESDEIVSY